MKLSQIVSMTLFLLCCVSHFTWAQQVRISQVDTLSIDSAITPATYDYLKHQFSKTSDSTLIVIKLNTPGGLISTTKDIITLIGAQNFPIAVWIGPEGASAASAGAIIAASAHFILMSPGTNMGAATPVGLGSDLKESDGRSKALNDLSALVRSLSHLRGRPSTPFEEMIKKASSFTDQEALKLKIIDAVIKRPQDIYEALSGHEFSLQGKKYVLEFQSDALERSVDPSPGQKLLEVLADPSLAYFLFLLGVALIYFELQAPGGYIAGTAGFGLLILAGISFQVLPLNWGAFGLIVLGVFFFVLEMYVTSYGLLALSGLACLVIGSLFVFHDEDSFISVEYNVLFSTLAGVLCSIGLIVWMLIKDKKNQTPHKNFFSLKGSFGIVSNSSAKHYQVKIQGETWKAISEYHLNVGDNVEVEDIDNDHLLIKVKKVN